jgi:hypothetical protein
MQKSLFVTMIKFLQQPLDLLGVNVDLGMAWVYDSIDKDRTTYKYFALILKTYIWKSSLPYMFIYILVTFSFGY